MNNNGISLIVNADDLAGDPGSIPAVLYAAKTGILTSASVIVNTDYENTKITAELVKDLSLGLHLNLFTGDFNDDSTNLFGLDGLLYRILNEREKEHSLKTQLSSDQLEVVRKEMVSQIELFKDFFNRYPAHLNYHFGLHFIQEVMTVYVDVAKEFNIPFRWASQYAGVVKPSFDRHPVDFIDILNHRDVSEDDLVKVLDALPDGVHEICVHPCITDQEYKSGQIEMLTSQEVKETIKRKNINLVSYEVL